MNRRLDTSYGPAKAPTRPDFSDWLRELTERMLEDVNVAYRRSLIGTPQGKLLSSQTGVDLVEIDYGLVGRETVPDRYGLKVRLTVHDRETREQLDYFLHVDLHNGVVYLSCAGSRISGFYPLGVSGEPYQVHINL